MTHTKNRLYRVASNAAHRSALCCIALSLVLLGGCAGVLPKPAAQPTLLALDDNYAAPIATAAWLGVAAATVIVEAPRASAGYDTRNIVYLRRSNEIEYFAFHQWVDTPAKMLAPLIVRALQRGAVFGAVALAPSAASGELRLETELVRLQQDFTQVPSRVRLTLQASLIETATRRVLAWREFDVSTVSASEDPYGGAAAANQAVRQVLKQLAAFCAEVATR